MWIPGRNTKRGIVLTIVCLLLVMLTWNLDYSHGRRLSSPTPCVVWCMFPIIGLVLGWSLELSQVGLLMVFVGMIVHWPLLGFIADRALARRERDRVESPPN
jgi:hypothetical protein